MTEFVPEEDPEDPDLAIDAQSAAKAESALESLRRSMSGQEIPPHFMDDVKSESAPVQPMPEKDLHAWATQQLVVANWNAQVVVPPESFDTGSNDSSAIPGVDFGSGQQSEPRVVEFPAPSPSPAPSVDFSNPVQAAVPEPGVHWTTPEKALPKYDVGAELRNLEIEVPRTEPKKSEPVDAIRNSEPPEEKKRSSPRIRKEKPKTNRPAQFAPTPFWAATPNLPIASEDAANPESDLGGMNHRNQIDYIQNQDRTNKLMVMVLDEAVSSLLHLQTELEAIRRVIERSFGGR